MRLKKINIRNFKSIKNLELVPSSNLHCLIGKNESGKSNILQAISLLGGSASDIELSDNTAIIGEYELDVPDITRLKQSAVKILVQNGSYDLSAIIKLQVTVNKNIKENNILQLQLVGGLTFGKEQSRFPADWNKLEKELFELLPYIELYEREDFIISPFDYKEFLEDRENPKFHSFFRLLALGGITEAEIEKFSMRSFNQMIEIRERASVNISALLNKHYNQEHSLELKIDSHDGIFTAYFNDAYHKIGFFEQRSTGFQYFFSFLINKIFLTELRLKNTIFLFDEPALSLHPTGQKDFVKLLEEISKEHVVFYTTHSPFSINRMHPNNVWVIEKSVTKGTILNPKPYLHNWRPLRTSLGIDISDSFFYADKSLLVEGPEDRIYIGALLNYFISKGTISLSSDLLSIIDAGSIANIPAMVQILISEERPLIVLMDDDDTHIHNTVKKKEGAIGNKEKFSVFKISSIQEGAVSIEDLLPHNLYVQAAKKYLDYLVSEKIITQKDAAEIVSDFSQVEKPKKYNAIAEEIFTKFYYAPDSLLDKKTPISKVGIANEFEKLLKEHGIQDPIEEEICFHLISTILTQLKLL